MQISFLDASTCWYQQLLQIRHPQQNKQLLNCQIVISRRQYLMVLFHQQLPQQIGDPPTDKQF
jgi:hypothetical protein